MPERPKIPTWPPNPNPIEAECPFEMEIREISRHPNGGLHCTTCGRSIPLGTLDEFRVYQKPVNDKERTRDERRFPHGYTGE